ncbi:MAG TPA: ABC transporter transmembrane domain-containing protein, partial [Microthrixaceae bacterium]|nr:ABC transporter transmembrane domain-containing protein [Microthrixaceae bacterium]
MTLAFGMAVVGQAVSALAPVISKVVIDDVITTQERPLAPWIVLLVLVGVFGFVAAFIRRFFGGRVSLDVQFDLRNAVYERLQRLDFASHDALHTGQLVSRASSDVGLIQTLLSLLPIVLGNIVLLAVSLAVMLWLSPPLTLVALVAVPCLATVALRLRRSVFPASWDAQQRAAEVAGVVDEAVSGVRVVKGFGQEDNERARLAATGADLYRSRVRLIGLQARYTPALAVIPVLAQVAVLALGGWLAIEGRISLGTLLAFSAYLVQLVAPVRMLATVVAFSQQARAGAERLLDVLDSNPLVAESPSATSLPPIAGELDFADVAFSYTRSDPILDGFTLHVAAGETVALVGSSGSGKSTLALLVPRFYDVTRGTITIDGADVRDVTFDSLRGQVGVVFEEPFLFSDTVRANIAYGRPDATDAEVRAAARMAESDGFINALPDGYDTIIGERGLTLSGGQRQRIALARALITDPHILILDDATSSIDATTEQEIHATLRKVMAGRTTLLVAHRRSTLRLAGRIVLVDDGRVIDQGSHDDLVARSQLYRQLLAGPDNDLDDPAPVAGTGSVSDPARLWPDDAISETGAKASINTTAPPRIAPGAGGGLGAALAATPELLAALARLPPADAEVRVDVAAEETAPPGSFRLRRFARPYRWALGLGLALVVADTIVTLLGPFLVRSGIDNGVAKSDLQALWVASGLFLLAAFGDWLLTSLYTLVTGRTSERMLFALRIRIFSHLQRLGLDYYDREMGGRIMTRMTTDVESLSQLLQQGLISAIV